MGYAKFDKWLIAENVDGSRQYIIHTQEPRFIGEILDNEEGGKDVNEFIWLDEPPLDVSFMARLMREAGEAINEYDRNLGID
ncbi:MAG: hypothetical protein GWN94_19825 [Phycisphaerae bacterium]|nr:hypothetical protein [Phycisphaerae bacterium]NIS53323.1 hypothetical protein [Phycisphaerae bacterium]NIX30477.1 hypothetical protein [Phycisphaerae bacterium]